VDKPIRDALELNITIVKLTRSIDELINERIDEPSNLLMLDTL
jgi:hypothetical protein